MSTLHVVSGATAASVSEKVTSHEVPCVTEPIRVPGAVQQHGFLLMTDAEMRTVLVASESAETFLHLPIPIILGSKLEALLDREVIGSLYSLRLMHESERDKASTFLGSFRIAGQFFSVVSHCSGTNRILEFELQDKLVGSEMMNGVITNFVGKLSRLQTEADLCEALARQVADLTGFDRVLLYSFDEEGHGTVLTEVSNGRLPSYLGLRVSGV